MFPPELERNSFRASNGELWWVKDDSTNWVGIIPQRHGPPAVYQWETKRERNEPWQRFINRGASDALAAAQRWPAPEDLPPDLLGRILYNLTWVLKQSSGI